MIFGHNGYTVEVQVTFAGGNHHGTDVHVYTLGPRGGKRPVHVPGSARRLARFADDMSFIAREVRAHEREVLARREARG